MSKGPGTCRAPSVSGCYVATRLGALFRAVHPSGWTKPDTVVRRGVAVGIPPVAARLAGARSPFSGCRRIRPAQLSEASSGSLAVSHLAGPGMF
jgi:hypothetical protein